MSSPKTSAGSQAGFTLVEALIAIVVLIFGLVAIANLFVVATSSNSNANASTAAAAQATEVLERLKAIPFNNLQGGVPPGVLPGCTEPVVPDGVTNCVVPGNFNMRRVVPGVGPIETTWTLTDPLSPQDNCFITVTSEGAAQPFRARTRAQFTTFRTCTQVAPCNPGC
jgi:type II secretory pathway pseudopilin PulG